MDILSIFRKSPKDEFSHQVKILRAMTNHIKLSSSRLELALDELNDKRANKDYEKKLVKINEEIKKKQDELVKLRDAMIQYIVKEADNFDIVDENDNLVTKEILSESTTEKLTMLMENIVKEYENLMNEGRLKNANT